MKTYILLVLILYPFYQVKSQMHDSVLFGSLVEKYVQTIEKGDTSLASLLWSHGPEVTFIRPTGTDYGFENVKKTILMFRDNFTNRELNWHDLRVSVYDQTAWLQFSWDFNAMMKSTDGSGQVSLAPLQTKGRETQVWHRLNNNWKLVHIHYSGMPGDL